MENLFFTVVGMSLTGSFVILFVLLARLALRKAPKIFSYALWAVVLFRLLCPFTRDSAFSLLPSAQMVYADGRGGGTDQVIQIQTGIPSVDRPVNDFLVDHPYQQGQPVVIGGDSEENLAPVINQLGPVPDWRTVPAAIWLAGFAVLMGYSLISLLRLRWKLIGAVPLEGERNVRLADHISSPFVLGVIRPKIYLPSGLSEGERDYILLHERTHIRRGDHILRALAWLALAVHWFNPLVWLAFYLAGKDMEMSCDEAVLERMGRDIRADYSTSLLRLSQGGRLPAGPLAFGGSGFQSRIKNVLKYNKPAFWVAPLALVGVLGLWVALATNPGYSSGPGRPIDFVYHEPGPAEIWVDSIVIDGMAWDECREIRLNEYPGVTFRLYPGKLTAVRDGEEVTLFDGMPIEDTYLCDLDGDGRREICAQVCIGSGIGDERIRVIRWLHESGSFSLLELKDRMTHDYYLGQVGDQLTVEERDYLGGARTRYGRLILTENGLDIGSDGGAGEAPDLPAAELTFTLNTAGEEHSVRMDGSVGNVTLEQGAFWHPASWSASGQDYPYGYLSMVYPGFAGEIDGSIYARWTDGGRRSVTVDTRMMAMIRNYTQTGWWEFTVELDSGTVMAMTGHPLLEDAGAELLYCPASISDGEAVETARIAAKLLAAGEEYYQAWLAENGRALPAEPSDRPGAE